MDLVIFEENKPFIVRSFREGDFDYMEAASEVVEADFFRFIKARTLLDELAETYPKPRKKEDVPFWFYIASNLSMRLHGVHAFDAFPLVVRSGGMLQAFGPPAGRKTVHPKTGDTTVSCEGFNRKNHYDRETPCDQDYLRKVAKDTDAQALMRWFGEAVVRMFHRHRFFDSEGIFIGDASYLFVKAAGKGVMKRLILDRGFLDGKAVSHCKKEYGIDILIPIRRNMEIYADAMALFQQSDVDWMECKPSKEETKEPPRRRPKAVSRREQKRQEKLRQVKEQQPPPPPETILIKKEAAAIGEFQRWDSCSVPLTVIANREHYADSHQELWFVIDTREIQDPRQAQQEYHLRISTEERYRQLKCFNDLTHFTSRAFSIAVNQVVFIMLAYNLLQLYLVKHGRKELNHKTLVRIRQQLLPSDNYVIVYYQNYFGRFTPFELVGFAVTLAEDARKKIAAKCHRIGRELDGALNNPRPR